MDAMIEYVDRCGLHYIPQIKKLIEPLTTHYGIDVFFYERIKTNGQFICLVSHDQVSSTWFDQGFYKSTPTLCSPQLFHSTRFFTDMLDDENKEVEKQLMRHLFGLYDDYMVVEKIDEDTVDLWGFASTKPNNHIRWLVSSAPHILNKFMRYFLFEARDIRAHVGENAVSLLPFRREAFYTGAACVNTLAEIQNTNAAFLHDITRSKLTGVEQQCVELYRRGLSAKESAEKLKRSRRTIESHFENIKIKLNLQKKSDLHRLKY